MTDDELFKVLNEIDERKAKMPTHCPDWCCNQHLQAIDEGCTVEEARKHVADDLDGRSDVAGERTNWHLWLYADPGEQTFFDGGKYLEMETHRGHDDRFLWRITSGDARVLARQLLHFADLADL